MPHMRNYIEWTSIFTFQGERIIIGDQAESFHFVKYRKPDNQFSIYADDSNPRWLTACQMLDYDTMAGADKFGNIFIVRLPSEVNEVTFPHLFPFHLHVF